MKYSRLIIGLIVIVVLVLGNAFLSNQSSGKDSPSSFVVQADRTFAQDVDSLPSPLISVPSVPSGKLPIYARSYILIDHNTKYPLAAKDPDTQVPIASITKIMTFVVAYDLFKQDHVITVPREATSITGSEIQLITGEQMTARSLFYGLLINSANDAAYTIAHEAGSVDRFADLMNEKAQALGLKHTNFKDPAGLDDSGYSTPRDIALLTDYALENDLFREIVGTQKHTIWSTDNRYKHDLINSNRLIMTEEPLYYPPSIGGKTGFTFEAGHCLVSAAQSKDNNRYIAVVLRTTEETKEASAREVRKLLSWVNQ